MSPTARPTSPRRRSGTGRPAGSARRWHRPPAAGSGSARCAAPHRRCPTSSGTDRPGSLVCGAISSAARSSLDVRAQHRLEDRPGTVRIEPVRPGSGSSMASSGARRSSTSRCRPASSRSWTTAPDGASASPGRSRRPRHRPPVIGQGEHQRPVQPGRHQLAMPAEPVGERATGSGSPFAQYARSQTRSQTAVFAGSLSPSIGPRPAAPHPAAARPAASAAFSATTRFGPRR